MLFVLIIGLYCILMLACLWGQLRLRKMQYRAAQGVSRPSVSLIVAVRDEESDLPSLMEDILRQEYPNFECILVDDHSTDGSLACMQAYAERGDIRLLRSEGEGKKQALLTGLKAAGGTYILTTDADCRLPETWISAMVQVAEDRAAALTIGPVRMEGNPLYSLDYLSLSAVTAGSAAMGHPVLCSGANLLVKREVYSGAADGLDLEEASGDDQFLLGTLKADGASVAYAGLREAQVVTKAPTGLKAFFSQRIRWAGKSRSYTDGEMMAVAILVLLTQVMLLLALPLSIGQHSQLLHWIPVMVTNLLVLWPAARFFHQERLLLWFPAAQLLYPFYVLAVAFGLCLPNRWKGRKL